ncbi:MAG: efflux RND transporter periplasmic adaptor subunit [Candidatus Eremiobacteraeota bacterium]|nr:efflux RND transporter periplasmic adaptor subunit [Candidatus Eremiobacteraeota bacterium]
MDKRTSCTPAAARMLAILVAWSVLLPFAGCAKKQAQNDAQPLSVTVAVARRGAISERLALTGVVAAKQQANLSSVITGTILAVDVNVGDRVSAGQQLVRIDDSTLRAQLLQSEGSLNSAQARLAQIRSGDTGTAVSATANLSSARVAYQTALANVRRNQQLFAQGYVSQAAVDQANEAAAAAEAQLRSAEVTAQNATVSGSAGSAAQSEIRSQQAAVVEAQGAVQVARAQIAQAVVVAPFDGVVTQRSVDPGSFAVPGTALVQVSALDPVYVNIGIPEEDLPYIHPGTAVDLSIGSLPGHSWHAQVSAVNSATTQGTLSYLARVVLPNPELDLKAGMVADVRFVKAQQTGAIIVPRAALVQSDNGTAVYVLEKSPECKCDGKAKLTSVVTGLETDTEMEISGEGIAPGVKVIVLRPDTLKDGSPVSISSGSGTTASPARAST